MEVRQQSIQSQGFRFSLIENGQEIAHAFLYLLKNDLHKQPLGFLEDVFVIPECQGHGLGTKLVKKVIEAAREKGCYKLIGNSRYSREDVHRFYIKLGFKDYGKEFRIDF